MRTCLLCEAPLAGKRSQSKFCTDAHRAKWHRDHDAPKATPPPAPAPVSPPPAGPSLETLLAKGLCCPNCGTPLKLQAKGPRQAAA